MTKVAILNVFGLETLPRPRVISAWATGQRGTAIQEAGIMQVIANDAVRVLLGELKETAEIRDEQGGLVGYFLPAASEEARLRQKVLAEYDPAEIASRKASGEKGRTTAEVLERLRSLERT